MEKRIPCLARVRRVPPHFSWVDHRLVRDGHISGPGPDALSLYLLLVSVGDADGVSWYSTSTAGTAAAVGGAPCGTGAAHAGRAAVDRVRRAVPPGVVAGALAL